MQNFNQPLPTVSRGEPVKPWPIQLGELLAQAAALSALHGVDADTFMQGAWAAFIDAHPNLREQLEEMQLKTQIEELRQQGRLGQA